MIRRLRAKYNPLFIIPFLVWVLLGAILMMAFGSRIIFTTVNTHHSPFWDFVMSKATNMGEGWTIGIVLLSLLIFKSCRNWWYILAAIVCNVLPALVIQALKYFFDAPRPLLYYNQASWIHIEDSWHHLETHSFPSGHSAGIFSLCCFLSMILPRHKGWIGLLLFGLALFVGYTRMYLAAHFYADVYVGSLVGTTVTLFCFALMRRWSNRSFTIVN